MTAHIQIPNIPPIVVYTGNGTQTVFTYNFPIFQEADLSVMIEGTLQIGNYAVTGAGETTGGTVVFNSPPPNQAVVTIQRRLPFSRVSDFIEGGDLAAGSLNSEFDYLVACLQQVQNDADPMLRFAKEEDVISMEVPPKLVRANKVLGFDGNGEMIVYETTDTFTSPTVIQSGTGAVLRQVGDKAKEIVSVKDFGAVGDNIVDDTAAFQNAINAHKYIYVPPGTYRITNSIEIDGGKILTGSGNSSIIKASSNTFDTVCLIGKNAALANLVIDGGDSALRIYGKSVPATHNFIQNIIIRNCNVGAELDGYTNTANPCDYNTLAHVTIEKPATHGVYVTRSGAGSPPNGNVFHAMRVQSLGTNITGSGFYLESARYHNTLTDCLSDLSGTPVACVRIGAESTRTIITNLRTNNANSVPNVQLESGSVETAIVNLRADSAGTAISDLSSGNYTALNAGSTEKNRFSRSHATDLTVDLQRYGMTAVALASAGSVTVDLSVSTYMVSTTNGATGIVLPKAAGTNSGAVITIKKTDTSINAVTISENTGTGPDGKSFKLVTQNDVVTIISDSSVWRILSSNVMQKNSIAITGLSFYKPDLSKSMIIVTASAGACTVELPPAATATSIGRPVSIKKIDGGVSAVRVTEEGATGPDNSVQSITAQYGAITVMSDGSKWYVIGKV